MHDATVHKSRSRRSFDAGKLHSSPDRSPAVSVGKRKQSRAHDGNQQRHRSRKDCEGIWRPNDSHNSLRKTRRRNFQADSGSFSGQKPIDRSLINSWEDSRIVDAVKKTGRKKLVIAALWTEMCLAMPAIHAMGDGYDVYVVTDASGGVSPEAHDMAIRRLVAAGAQPITWLGMAGELQRDWARAERLGEVAQILFDHAGSSGTVLAWELANEAKRA